jgi:hypothetical protein
MKSEEFKILMQSVAEAWTHGKVEKAADYYTQQGLNAFCGGRRPEGPIRITWSHLSFDENQQVGLVQYNYQRIGVGERSAQVIWQFRAVAMVSVTDGKISNWTEYRK